MYYIINKCFLVSADNIQHASNILIDSKAVHIDCVCVTYISETLEEIREKVFSIGNSVEYWERRLAPAGFVRLGDYVIKKCKNK